MTADETPRSGATGGRPDTDATADASAGARADSSASSQAREGARQAGEKAQQSVDQARDQLHSVLDGQKQVAAGQLDGVATALHSSAEQLRGQDQQAAAGYVDSAAEGLSRWSHSLRERDVDNLAGSMQTFARQRPAVFLAGAALFGFTATRFLKSSQARSRQQDSAPQPPQTTAAPASSQRSPSAPTTESQ